MSANLRTFTFNNTEYIQLPADISAGESLAEWLTAIAKDLQMPDKALRQCLIVTDEIFSNIAYYAYPQTAGEVKIKVAFNLDTHTLMITFIDKGVAYNPLESPEPDITASVEDRRLGGLGIFMVKKLMDTVEYKREKECNILTLTKQIK